MRLHRFYIPNEIGNDRMITVADRDMIHQWRNVFRFGESSSVILFDGTGHEFLARIISLGRDEAVAEIVERSKPDVAPARELYLFVALIKKDNFEWVLEKGTEIGVNHFIPIIADRSEKKDLNMERANKIAIEASEQSGRVTLPRVHEPMALADALAAFRIPSIAFDCAEGKDQKNKLCGDEKILGVFIGPEGGWTDNERGLFREKGIALCSLGKQVLRAETAAISVAAMMLLGSRESL